MIYPSISVNKTPALFEDVLPRFALQTRAPFADVPLSIICFNFKMAEL